MLIVAIADRGDQLLMADQAAVGLWRGLERLRRQQLVEHAQTRIALGQLFEDALARRVGFRFRDEPVAVAVEPGEQALDDVGELRVLQRGRQLGAANLTVLVLVDGLERRGIQDIGHQGPREAGKRVVRGRRFDRLLFGRRHEQRGRGRVDTQPVIIIVVLSNSDADALAIFVVADLNAKAIAVIAVVALDLDAKPLAVFLSVHADVDVAV